MAHKKKAHEKHDKKEHHEEKHDKMAKKVKVGSKHKAK